MMAWLAGLSIKATLGGLLKWLWPYLLALAVVAGIAIAFKVVLAERDHARAEAATLAVQLDQLQVVNASNAAELARIQQDMAAAAAAVALQQRETKELRRVLTIAEDALRQAPEAERNAPISPLRLDALRRVRAYQSGRAD